MQQNASSAPHTPTRAKPEIFAISTGGRVSPAPSGVGFDDPEVDRLRAQLRDAEMQLAAHKIMNASGQSTPMPTGLADIMGKQNIILEKALSQKKNPNTTIRVESKIFWPKLGDDGPGGK